MSDELRKILDKYDTFTVLEVREKVTNDLCSCLNRQLRQDIILF